MLRNTEKMLKMRNAQCRTRNMAKNCETWKMRHKHCLTWNMARNTEKREKREMYTVGPGKW
jgi:hypothetical protein